MKIYDISRSLRAGMAVWPGDTPFQLTQTLFKKKGSSVNLSTLTMSAHTGSHVDAPRHFSDEGETMAELDLRPYWGPVQVVTVTKSHGPLFPDDFDHVELGQAVRLIVHSDASEEDPARFPAQIVYPSPELADFLGELDIILYGTDAPSMDDLHSGELPGHHQLWQNGIAILEGLDLSGVPDGLYELVALPLKVVGGDGSPVRAALRSWSHEESGHG